MILYFEFRKLRIYPTVSCELLKASSLFVPRILTFVLLYFLPLLYQRPDGLHQFTFQLLHLLGFSYFRPVPELINQIHRKGEETHTTKTHDQKPTTEGKHCHHINCKRCLYRNY